MSELVRSDVMDAQMGKVIESQIIPLSPAIQQAISKALNDGHKTETRSDAHSVYMRIYNELWAELKESDQKIRDLKTICARQVIQIEDYKDSIRRLKSGKSELDIHKHL